MTAILDYIINHNKEFAGMTDYEKWEYREDVIAGMKAKTCYIITFIGYGLVIAGAIFVVGMLGN